MSEPDTAERLRALRARVEQAQAAQNPPPVAQDSHSQAHAAWRMVTELVAGLAIGFGIGYGLDALFGTRPLFLVLFILLGFAAGVRVMLRTAQELQVRDGQGTAGSDAGAPVKGKNGDG